MTACAVLASYRPILEKIASTWLPTRSTALFRDGPWAQQTFDLTIKWARPTTRLYQEYPAELFDAALRGADHAVRHLVIAALHEVDGYELDTLIHNLSKNPEILATAAEDAAFLSQDAEPASHQLAIAIRFWSLLLDTNQTTAPTEALTRLGRWALVSNIDDNRWAQLTARTLDITDGRIDYAISVADRAARIPPNSTSRSILLRLLGHSESWERHHTAEKAIEALRASTTTDDSFHRLRTRLIDLGHHQASTITPSV